MEEHKGKI
jgi:hypothetical protein